MTPIRPLCLAVAGLIAAAASPAAAQSRCGASHVIEPGDTLYRVSQQCGVALSRIYDLNPSVNPRSMEVGTAIRLESRPGADDGGDTADRTGVGDADYGGTYRVRPGDTLSSIAQALGVGLVELIAANEHPNPFALVVGELLDVPGGNGPGLDEPGASVSIAPRSGTTAETVALSARGLPPGDRVTIGVGERATDWTRLREVRVGEDGSLTARVAVPDWADPEDDIIFLVDTDRGRTFRSETFDVVALGDDLDPGAERLTLEGRVQQGVECPILRTPDGDIWSLDSAGLDYMQGEYVEVTGRRAGVSFCQQGVGTIDVASIEEIAPPQDEAELVTLEGNVAPGIECPILRTPDGDVWGLASMQAGFPRGEYIQVTGRPARVSYCGQGRGTLEVARVEDILPPWEPW